MASALADAPHFLPSPFTYSPHLGVSVNSPAQYTTRSVARRWGFFNSIARPEMATYLRLSI